MYECMHWKKQFIRGKGKGHRQEEPNGKRHKIIQQRHFRMAETILPIKTDVEIYLHEKGRLKSFAKEYKQKPIDNLKCFIRYLNIFLSKQNAYIPVNHKYNRSWFCTHNERIYNLEVGPKISSSFAKFDCLFFKFPSLMSFRWASYAFLLLFLKGKKRH